jgi:cytosine/adenosine deaminase-related metal-dependent hydrolase
LPLRIENVDIVLGDEMDLVKNGFIEVENGRIKYVGEERLSQDLETPSTVLNTKGLIAIPGLIDAHTHFGDSIAKDIGIGSTLDQLVHPIHGLKTKLLKETPEAELENAMRATAKEMLASGITTIADFREAGLRGVQLARKALASTKLRAIILGRPSYHFEKDRVTDNDARLTEEVIDELKRTLELGYGLGVSGGNEYTNAALKQISDIAKSERKIIAVHASESERSRKFSLETFGRGEVDRVLDYLKPDFLVHLTNSDENERQRVAKEHVPVVCCPRTNSMLGLGLPPIAELLDLGVTVALGSDNVMLSSPDMFREMDFTSRTIRATKRDPSAVSSKAVLKMATINAARALGLGSELGSISRGKKADIVFLDSRSERLQFSRDVIASIVHRAGPADVRCVMVDGEVAYGSIPNA